MYMAGRPRGAYTHMAAGPPRPDKAACRCIYMDMHIWPGANPAGVYMRIYMAGVMCMNLYAYVLMGLNSHRCVDSGVHGWGPTPVCMTLCVYIYIYTLWACYIMRNIASCVSESTYINVIMVDNPLKTQRKALAPATPIEGALEGSASGHAAALDPRTAAPGYTAAGEGP